MAVNASQPLRGPTRTILEAIKTNLVTLAVTGTNQITWAARDQTPAHQAEHLIILRPRGFTTARNPGADGEGRIVGKVKRILAVHLRVRQARDEPDRDTEWLLDETNGYLDFEDLVLDALDLFWPADAQGNDLLAEPMRVLDASDVAKDPRDSMWGDGTLYFEMQYMADLDQARQ